MRVYQERYTKNGKRCRAKKWYVDFMDHLGRRHRLPGFPEKRSTETLARNLQDLISFRLGSQQPNADLQRWIEVLPNRIVAKFVLWDMLDAKRTEGAKSLLTHLEDWERPLRAKNSVPRYVQMTVSRARKLMKGCHFKFWSDISASRVECYLADLQEGPENISAATRNYYLRAIQQFSRWMVEDRRAVYSPVAHLKRVNEKTDRRHDRRPLEPTEIGRFLATTMTAKTRFRMTGYQRALMYRLAMETGLRASELRSLTVRSFNFECCLVTVAAAYSKHRREDVLPLRRDTTAELRRYVAGKMPDVQVFPIPARPGDMLKADLAEAGIPYIDESGKYFDFHALRHTTASLLADAKVHPKTAQSIMRHSDVNLTMSRYSHVFRGQEAEAVESLPCLATIAAAQNAQTMGTDDRPVKSSAICSAIFMPEHSNDLRQSAKATPKVGMIKTCENDGKMRFLAKKACRRKIAGDQNRTGTFSLGS
ncbi:MAG: site-specific integrase [Sedimentisphaerales bacterium]|nr:site-specific integrase [Sedimentisphaerales bacterium]